MQVLDAMLDRGVCGIVPGPMMVAMGMSIDCSGTYVTGATRRVVNERRMAQKDTPIARRILRVPGPGACRSVVIEFRYRSLHRPTYALGTDALSAPAPAP